MSEVIAFRRFATPNEPYSSKVHAPSTGHEVFPQDPIKATFKSAATGKSTGLLPVYRISPLGIQVDTSSLDREAWRRCLAPGSKVDLTVYTGVVSYPFSGVVILDQALENNRTLIGIRWCMTPSPSESEDNRRTGPRWLCGEGFLPTGIAANPLRFNDFIHFSVADISSEGLQLVTSLRNKLLMPGMELDTIVSFPMIGQVSMAIKILNARIRYEGTKECLGLGAQIIAPDRQVLEAIGQYLFQFGPDATAKDLRANDLKPRSVASAIEYSFVRTAEEYKEVLQLRKLAYSQAGKSDPNLPVEKMGDIFDTRSRIFLARHKGRAIGSFRLIFLEPDEKNEHERFVKFPDNFPRRDEIVNASRLCTHPDYRGSDLFYTLVRHMAMAVIQTRKRYLVSGCTPALLEVYKRFGFEGTGIRFRHGDLADVDEELIIWDALGAVTGSTVGPRVWKHLYSDLYAHLASSHRIEITPLINLRLRMYSLLGVGA